MSSLTLPISPATSRRQHLRKAPTSGWPSAPLAVRFELQGDEPAVIFESLFALSKPVHTKLLVNFGSGPSADFKFVHFTSNPAAHSNFAPLKPFINPHTDRSLSA